MQDLISRQMATDALRKMQTYKLFSGDDMLLIDQAGVMTELMLLPPAQLGTNLASLGTDRISRQAVFDALRTCYDTETITMDNGDEYINYGDAVGEIEQLPPIQPKRGRWLKLDMHRGMADHKCTACEQECYVPTCMGEPMYAFCPNCGAKMEVTT